MKTKICPLCGGYVFGNKKRKYCAKCRPQVEKPAERKARLNFQAEWTRWKNDFAIGKTVSNL